MSFFKNIFSSKKDKPASANDGGLKAIYSEDGFNRRYEENIIEPEMFVGCLKMIESCFIENNLERKADLPFNHPVNLDKAVKEGLGFHQYCKGFNIEDGQIVAFLAFAFADFLVTQFGFKFYKDKEPEFPLRGMTLMYDKNGAMVMIYPMEYALKALNNERTFEDLFNQLNNQIPNLPSASDFVDQLRNEE